VPGANGDAFDQIRQLGKLRDEGLITEMVLSLTYGAVAICAASAVFAVVLTAAFRQPPARFHSRRATRSSRRSPASRSHAAEPVAGGVRFWHMNLRW
jgi:hypothetical protein